MPPIDGLQLIAPSVSRLCVSSSVLHSHARCSQRRLGAGMAATDDNDVETVRKEHGQSDLRFYAQITGLRKRAAILLQFAEK
jgi:hypothetical protein